MSLYSGFNALGLATNANDLWMRKNAEKQNRINGMKDTLFKILDMKHTKDTEEEEKARYNAKVATEQARYDAEQKRLADEKAEAKADLENRKASAVKALVAKGVPEEEAISIASSLSNPDTAVVEALNLGKEKRGREYAKEDRADEFNEWLQKNNITNKQDLFKSVVSQAFGNLTGIDVKDWGNSRAGVEMHNRSVKSIKKLLEEHPEMASAFELLQMGEIDPETSGTYYDEDMLQDADDILKGDGPDKTSLIEEYFKNLQDNNKLTYFQKNFPDKMRQLLQNGDGKKLSPYVLTQDLGKGVTTEKGRNKEIKDEEARVDWDNKMSALNNAYDDETGNVAKPNLSKAEMKKAWNTKVKGVYIYRDALQDLYKYYGD